MKLSIIMPCYNVANTLARALDSIIMQKVNFDYEVIIIDDCSSDDSNAIAQGYQSRYPFIKILTNKINSGNAHSFYVGLSNAEGDYFCVLDGDDYYTIPDKLQRQVDFLDYDTKLEYVATATNFIIDLGDGNISVPDRSTYKEYSYADFLTRASGYYHTATYMYRNIFRGNVPEQFDNPLYRGDNPRTLFHLQYSGKKIKILDFVGSAYVFEFNGIWSSKSQKEQFTEMMNWQLKHKEFVDTGFEKKCCDTLAKIFEEGLKNAKDDYRRYPAITVDQALTALIGYTKKFAFKETDFMLKHVYCSEYIDTLCASIGYVNKIRDVESGQTKANEDNLLIVISSLNPKGGGIFEEISELVDLYSDKNVTILSTVGSDVKAEARERLSVYKNLKLLNVPDGESNRLRWMAREIAKLSPYRAYYYCGHDDPYSVALMQENPCEKVVLFSFDQGYICGLNSHYITNLIAKRPVDYWLLHNHYSDKVIYIPTWGKGLIDCEGLKYEAFHGHDKIITACGAARFHKLNGAPPRRYIDLIIKILKEFGGKHYHFGPIPEEILNEIQDTLKKAGVSPKNFVHVLWTDNIPKYLLEHHIDLFLEPFPVASYKLTLDVLAAGVPLVAYDGITRMTLTDFLPADAPKWKNFDELVEILKELDKNKLEGLSASGIKYFQETHSQEVVAAYLRANKGEAVPPHVTTSDNSILEMMDFLRVIDNNFRIKIYDTVYYKGKNLVVGKGGKVSHSKLQGMIKCYKEHGFVYTFKRVLWHLGLRDKDDS